jgi:hypothetical protein
MAVAVALLIVFALIWLVGMCVIGAWRAGGRVTDALNNMAEMTPRRQDDGRR